MNSIVINVARKTLDDGIHFSFTYGITKTVREQIKKLFPNAFPSAMPIVIGGRPEILVEEDICWSLLGLVRQDDKRIVFSRVIEIRLPSTEIGKVVRIVIYKLAVNENQHLVLLVEFLSE
jgi:hypothetical protein